MPYTHYTTDERNALQAMEGMALPKTSVDRKTKLLLAKIMADKSAATLNRAAVRAFKPMPADMRNTLTVDNGKEFAAHKSLSQTLGIDIPFAHPYRSWERGLNEHTNGLLRQYRPEKIPFDSLTQKQLGLFTLGKTDLNWYFLREIASGKRQSIEL
jgi:IS30 family transposase